MEQEKSRVFPLLISVGEREYLHRESFSHNMSVSNYVKSLVLPKNYESRLVKLRKENSASEIKPHLRWRNHYAPGKLILSRSRNFNVDVLIDDNDLEIIKKYQWHYTGGYVSTFVKLGKGKFTSKTLHQILNPTWNMTDHIDRNPRNNQRSNLRPCTSSENARNHKISKNNTTGIIGVSEKITKDSNGNVWRYWVSHWREDKKAKSKHFPYTPEGFEQAVNLRNLKVKELYGEFAPIQYDKVKT